MIDGFHIFDLHVHSELSGCADKPPHYSALLVLQLAGRLGVDGVAFTDHVLERRPNLPPELVAHFADRPGLERIDALRRNLAALDLAGLPPVRIGAEIDAWGGGLFAVGPAGRKRLDHAVLSANHPRPPGAPGPEGDEPDDVARWILSRTREAVDSRLAASIAHPLLALYAPHPAEVYAAYPRLGLAGLLESARDAGIAFGFQRHLITHQHLVRLDDVAAVYRLAVEVGVKLAFETDSHHLWHLACIVPLVQLARRIGLSPRDFIHDFPA